MSKDYEGSHGISGDFEVFPVGARAAIENAITHGLAAYGAMQIAAVELSEHENGSVSRVTREIAAELAESCMKLKRVLK